MGAFRQKAECTRFLSEPYETVSLMKHAVSLKGTKIFP